MHSCRRFEVTCRIWNRYLGGGFHLNNRDNKILNHGHQDNTIDNKVNGAATVAVRLSLRNDVAALLD